jgi:hypothetical protein
MLLVKFFFIQSVFVHENENHSMYNSDHTAT